MKSLELKIAPPAIAALIAKIAPEERALTALFGTEYTAYMAKVCRWL